MGFGLFALTLVYPEWIEALTGLEPDAGSGALESAIAGALLLLAMLSAAFANRVFRRLARAQLISAQVLPDCPETQAALRTLRSCPIESWGIVP